MRGPSAKFPKLRKNNNLLILVSGFTHRQKVWKADLKVLLQIEKEKRAIQGCRDTENFWKGNWDSVVGCFLFGFFFCYVSSGLRGWGSTGLRVVEGSFVSGIDFYVNAACLGDVLV